MELFNDSIKLLNIVMIGPPKSKKNKIYCRNIELIIFYNRNIKYARIFKEIFIKSFLKYNNYYLKRVLLQRKQTICKKYASCNAIIIQRGFQNIKRENKKDES